MNENEKKMDRAEEILDVALPRETDMQAREVSEDELKAKEIEELERLTELANVDVDFSAQTGGPSTKSKEEDNEVPEMEPVFDLSGKKK